MADHRNEAMKMRDIPKDESRLSKMMRKIKKDPAVVVGEYKFVCRVLSCSKIENNWPMKSILTY